MINFRFHLVSLIAVFLAIGIGIAMGASFMDVATVDAIRGQLDRLEDNYRDRGVEIDQWKAQTREMDRTLDQMFLDDSMLLAGRLAGRRVVLVAAADAPAPTIDAIWAVLVSADAERAGDMRLLSGSPLSDPDAADLARALLTAGPAAPTDLDAAVIDELGDALAVLSYDPSQVLPTVPDVPDPVPGDQQPPAQPGEDTGSGGDGQPDGPGAAQPDGPVPPSGSDGADTGASDTTSTTQASGDGSSGTTQDGAPNQDAVKHARDVVDGLIGLRVISLDTHGSDPTSIFPDVGGVTYVIVGTDGGGGSVMEHLQRLARTAATRRRAIVTVVDGGTPRRAGALADEGEGPVISIVDDLRGDAVISSRLSTVDGIEELTGRVSVALAVAEQAQNRTGQYGRRRGAESLFPMSPPR